MEVKIDLGEWKTWPPTLKGGVILGLFAFVTEYLVNGYFSDALGAGVGGFIFGAIIGAIVGLVQKKTKKAKIKVKTPSLKSLPIKIGIISFIIIFLIGLLEEADIGEIILIAGAAGLFGATLGLIMVGFRKLIGKFIVIEPPKKKKQKKTKTVKAKTKKQTPQPTGSPFFNAIKQGLGAVLGLIIGLMIVGAVIGAIIDSEDIDTGSTNNGGSIIGTDVDAPTDVISVRKLGTTQADEIGFEEVAEDTCEYWEFIEGGKDCGNFYVSHTVSPNSKYRLIADTFENNETFEDFADLLNNKFALPYDIEIKLLECEGSKNMYYNYANKEIRICYELLQEWNDTYYENYFPSRAAESLVSTIYFTMFHEVGHALVFAYQIPITGDEEEAVDQLATWLLVDADLGEAALSTTNWFFSNPDSIQSTSYYYWHELKQERFRDITCWVYGSDTTRWNVYKGIVTQQDWQCEGDYTQISRSWPTLLHKYFIGGPPGTECTEENFHRYANMDCGDFYLVYGDVGDQQEVEDILKEQGLESLIDLMNEEFALPVDVKVVAETCGVANASFSRGPEGAVISMCHELISEDMRLFAKMYDNEEDIFNASMEAYTFTYFHELGHALHFLYRIPATGTAEDVADQVATYLSVEAGFSALALSAADEYNLSDEERIRAGRELTRGYFADTHSLNAQRFFNYICWVYGNNTEKYAYLVEEGILPESRAVRCEGEYWRLKTSMDTLINSHRQLK